MTIAVRLPGEGNTAEKSGPNSGVRIHSSKSGGRTKGAGRIRWPASDGKPPVVTRSLDNCPALVLNADFRPLSYFPLSLWSWQDAVKSVFLDKVNIISNYEQEVHSPNFSMPLPSVVVLKDYVKPAPFPAFTRFNVFLRDEFSCQYCGSPEDLTFDHVIPRSKGGRTTWQNVTTACSPCNLRKANKMPEQIGMHPRINPDQPTVFELQNKGRQFPPNYLHESWLDYLYWDVELES